MSLQYRVFDSVDWLALKAKALESKRRRAHYNLHGSYEEPVQKTLICLLHKTYIQPHYHQHGHQKELFVVLKGNVKVIFFDSTGLITEIVFLGQDHSGVMIEVLPNSIHTVVCLTESAYVLETKQGPFEENNCKVHLSVTNGAKMTP